ncbi:MAG: NAD-dependent epimerase/dehydratase family protein [Desulforhopalus sp.]
MKIKSALVTGGGGFVGKAIVRQLLEKGIETRVIGRHHYPEIEALGAYCHVGDICDESAMDAAAESVEVVFHVAALAGIWGSAEQYHRTNVVGTENVITCCRRQNVSSLVYTSTPSVVFNRSDIRGGDESLPYPERFLCHYARTKVAAERLVLAAHSKTLATCALRPHLIWGPGDPHLLPRLLEKGRNNELKQIGDGTNLVDISYIDNVAHAHILAAANLLSTCSAGGKSYFISQGEPVNLWTWIAELYNELGIAQITRKVSFPIAYRVGGVLETFYNLFSIQGEPKMTRFLAEQLAKSHYFSINNAKNDLGYEPVVSTAEGLRRTVEWLKNG